MCVCACMFAATSFPCLPFCARSVRELVALLGRVSPVISRFFLFFFVLEPFKRKPHSRCHDGGWTKHECRKGSTGHRRLFRHCTHPNPLHISTCVPSTQAAIGRSFQPRRPCSDRARSRTSLFSFIHEQSQKCSRVPVASRQLRYRLVCFSPSPSLWL